MKRVTKFLLAMCVTGSLMNGAALAGSPADCFMFVDDNSNTPVDGTFGFWASTNNASYILTEDAFNSSTGTNNGASSGAIYFPWTSVENAPYSVNDGAAFTSYTYHAATGHAAYFSNTVPNSTDFCDTVNSTIALTAGVGPGRIPGGTFGLVTATPQSDGDINLSWSAAPGATSYSVYSSANPCGSNLDPCGGVNSNGIYTFEKSTAGTATKVTKTLSGTYWFVVVPASLNLGMHSDEVSVALVVVPTPTPTLTPTATPSPVPTDTPVPTNTPAATNTPTATATSANTPTPTPTATNPGPTNTPSPTPTATPVPPVPTTTFWGVSLLLVMMSMALFTRRVEE